MLTKVSIVAGVLLAAFSVAQGQSGEADNVPSLRGVYFRSPSGWIGVPANLLMPLENGTAKWLLGFGHSDAIAERSGPHAAVQTSLSKPTFYMRGFPATSGIYLVREVQKQEYREIHMPVSGEFREWAHFRAKDLIDVDVRHAGGDVMALTPRSDLKPGEYAIVSVLESNQRGIHVSFDFGVNQ